jgi:hypothetical protein
MINYILLTVAVFNIILSIIIIILSTVRKRKSDGSTYLDRNYPGIYSGIIIMIFSVSFLLLMLLGKIPIEDFNDIAFWGIGGIFFVCGVVLLIGFININQVEMFTVGSLPISTQPANNRVAQSGSAITGIPTGICEKDGIYGTLMSNGVCVIPAERLENCKENAVAQYKEQVNTQIARENARKCKSNRQTQLNRPKEGFNQISRGDIDGNKVKSNVVNKELGICQFKNKFGSNEFGYMHPYFGRKCMTAQQLTTLLNKYPDQKKIHNVKGNIYYHPYQSTKCLGYPKNDLVSYDLMCKENFGNDYGVRKIDGENCPQNDFRAYCENGYQAGVKLGSESTKCVPVGSDMNVVCQNKNQREKKSNYMTLGYKDIKYDGCPDGYQRGICDGNYYDGIQLFENTTSCFPETNNPDRMCKKEFGILSFSEKIIADNCKIGNIRAKCANTNSRKN